ncbi:hypothetical protein [Pseudomonas sp.]|uniref:hypothetical protein n=1 Tax=Pseudomonas sp. TaxID=306 RepID=UPI00258C0E84|nr:hypothetical protein [Pseudomonas sp.]
MTDTSKMRSEFEAAFVAQKVAELGEDFRDSAVYMLKRDGDFEKPPTPYELHRRELGLYDWVWVETAWWAWQASRQAVVVELPRQHFEFEGDTAPEMFSAEVIKAIEAQGLRCEVKP